MICSLVCLKVHVNGCCYCIVVGLTSSIGPINSFIISILSTFGHEAVAAFGTTRIEAFCFILLMALAVGMGPVIGQNFGARQIGRVEETGVMP